MHIIIRIISDPNNKDDIEVSEEVKRHENFLIDNTKHFLNLYCGKGTKSVSVEYTPQK